MMLNPHEIERHFGIRNYRAWRDLQDAAEISYAVRTEGHFAVDNFQPAQEFGKILADFSGEWLDVGCGKLVKPAYMKHSRNIVFFGIDPIATAVNRKFPFVQAIGDFLPFNRATFDGVMFCSSLDHCIVPLQALEEAHRVLRPGGNLLIWLSLRPENERFEDWLLRTIYFQSRYNARHNWAFSKRSLESVVQSAGFRVARWEALSDLRWFTLVANAVAPD